MLILKILLCLPALAALCLQATPFKKLDQYSIGSPAPKVAKREKNSPGWVSMKKFLFQMDKAGQIESIQRSIEPEECVLIDKVEVTGNITEAESKRLFPACSFEAMIGGNVLQCNGFKISWSSARMSWPEPLITISKQDIEMDKVQRAKEGAETAIQDSLPKK